MVKLRGRTVTPSSWALRSLLPAASPATTALVFLDTDPDTLAPRASSFSPASLREADSSSPVRTKVKPASRSPAGWAVLSMLTPASFRRRIRSFAWSPWK